MSINYLKTLNNENKQYVSVSCDYSTTPNETGLIISKKVYDELSEYVNEGEMDELLSYLCERYESFNSTRSLAKSNPFKLSSEMIRDIFLELLENGLSCIQIQEALEIYPDYKIFRTDLSFIECTENIKKLVYAAIDDLNPEYEVSSDLDYYSTSISSNDYDPNVDYDALFSENDKLHLDDSIPDLSYDYLVGTTQEEIEALQAQVLDSSSNAIISSKGLNPDTMAIINEEYQRKFNNVVNINNLLQFAENSDYIDRSTSNFYQEEFMSALKNIALTNTELVGEVDIAQELKQKVKLYTVAINDYLASLENPALALSRLLSDNINTLFMSAINLYITKHSLLNPGICKLIQESSFISKYSIQYEQLLKSIIKSNNGSFSNDSFYTPMNNCQFIKSLSDVNEVVTALLTEIEIIKKFKRNQVVSLIKNINSGDVTRNICSSILYNYIFLYGLNGSFDNLSINEIDANKIMNIIKNDGIKTNDVIDTILMGPIEFSANEINYIMVNFIPLFEDNILNKHYLDRFVIDCDESTVKQILESSDSVSDTISTEQVLSDVKCRQLKNQRNN